MKLKAVYEPNNIQIRNIREPSIQNLQPNEKNSKITTQSV